MEEIRLNKYIGDSGFCSRRAADELIAAERVTVNGVTAKMGVKVSLTDKVRIDGEMLKPHTPVENKAQPEQTRRKIGKDVSLRKEPVKKKREQPESARSTALAGRRSRIRKDVKLNSEPETAGTAKGSAVVKSRNAGEPKKEKTSKPAPKAGPVSRKPPVKKRF